MIRLIQEKDLEKIVELFDDYRRGYRQEAEIEHAYDFLKERFDKQESIVFLAEEDDKILGFTQVYPKQQSSAICLSRIGHASRGRCLLF